MPPHRQYATAGAFRTALEARLAERARRDAVDLHRLRRQVAFDRLLARMFDSSQPVRDGWILKGGYALEMRFHMARSTKDLDLTVRSAQGRAGDTISLRERLQLAASIDLPDFFTFIVGEAMAELNQAPEGGARFPVDARLDGRTFIKFHVDLGVGDEVLEPVESVEGDDWLGFAGIAAAVVPVLSIEQHWAEKFHAYTRPRETPNSRVMRQDFFEEFCREFAKEMNRLRMEQRAGLSGSKRELERVKRDIQKVIEAIKAGFALPELKVEMDALQVRKEALLAQLAEVDEPPPLLHPSMADLYRSKVEKLAAALQREDTRLEASEMLRGLIDSIVLIPDEGQLRIELRGNLAAMLSAAQQTKRSPETGDLLVPVQLVAGAGFEPATFGL
jgi:flagellar motility protein MotE (MotC chaperone)